MLLVLSGADSRTVVSPDGTRLAVRLAGARAAATVVFVHGYPEALVELERLPVEDATRAV